MSRTGFSRPSRVGGVRSDASDISEVREATASSPSSFASSSSDVQGGLGRQQFHGGLPRFFFGNLWGLNGKIWDFLIKNRGFHSHGGTMWMVYFMENTINTIYKWAVVVDFVDIWGFPSMGNLQNGWIVMENTTYKWMITRFIPLFQETSAAFWDWEY